jgi:hypothetical protein
MPLFLKGAEWDSVLFQMYAGNARELATWLMQFLFHKGEPPVCTHKRNSELINSLLGLPKVLNEAGRK